MSILNKVNFKTYSNFEKTFQSLIKNEEIDKANEVGLKNIEFLQRYFANLNNIDKEFLVLDFVNNYKMEILKKFIKDGAKKIKDKDLPIRIRSLILNRNKFFMQPEKDNQGNIVKIHGCTVIERRKIEITETDVFLKKLAEKLAVWGKRDCRNYNKSKMVANMISDGCLKNYVLYDVIPQEKSVEDGTYDLKYGKVFQENQDTKPEEKNMIYGKN